LALRPADVQRIIFACAEATKQISNHPPLDWDVYKAQIFWPTVTPWKAGGSRDAAQSTAGRRSMSALTPQHVLADSFDGDDFRLLSRTLKERPRSSSST
jgi:hypothetical protein